MPVKDDGLRLTAEEIAEAFHSPGLANKYPPILSVRQVAGLLQVPVGTIYDWSSRGRLRRCCRKVGKHLRFFRDRLVQELFNEKTQ